MMMFVYNKERGRVSLTFIIILIFHIFHDVYTSLTVQILSLKGLTDIMSDQTLLLIGHDQTLNSNKYLLLIVIAVDDACMH